MRTLLLPGIALTSLCTVILLLNDSSGPRVSFDETQQERVAEQTPEGDLPINVKPEISVWSTGHAAPPVEQVALERENLSGKTHETATSVPHLDLVNDYDVAPIQEPDQEALSDFDSLDNDAFQPAPYTEREIVDRLDAAFSSESYDGAWAAATESALLHSFAEARLDGTQLTGASCRSSLCRIDVTHADKLAEGRFLAAFAGSGEYVSDGAKGFYAKSVDYNGMPRTVFFWAREGHELPATESN